MAGIARWRRWVPTPRADSAAVPSPAAPASATDVLYAVPLPASDPDRINQLAGLLRGHQDVLAAERLAAGVEAQTFWLQHLDEADVLLVHLRAGDPWGAARRLAQPADEETARVHARITAALGADPWHAGDTPPVEVRRFSAPGTADEFPEVMAFATVLLPGVSAGIPERRRAIDRFDDVRHELTGSRQEAHFVQRTRIGELYLIYARGEVSRLLEVIRTSDHPLLQAERDMSVFLYGIDLTQRFMPIPSPLHAWTAPVPLAVPRT
ncbi:hypothetical protein ABC795_09200 [Blastococcus sp. HT6-30]|uniref:hypothetical protein n=1 Tax=Blastococcus sp. HT6-30 TaxID=3144843 RepID=UPI003218FBBD